MPLSYLNFSGVLKKSADIRREIRLSCGPSRRPRMEAALPQGDFDSEEDYQLSPRPAGAAALSNFLQNFYIKFQVIPLSLAILQAQAGWHCF